jgi:hypothetical protein
MPGPLRAFCIGHVPPVFTPALPFDMLCPHPLGLPNERVLADDRFGPQADGAALAEYSQLFGLQALLEAGDVVADRLYLFQYRKFLGFRHGGVPANAPWARIASPHEAATLCPGIDELQAAPHAAVVGALQPMGTSLAQNYALVHVADDFAMFTAALQACGYTPAQIRAFCSFQGLVPSPALCLVDTPVFLRLMTELQRVWRHFAQHYGVQREGYQRRVAGYLLERLHSQLLCQWLQDGSLPSVGQGQRYIVLEAG